MTTSPDLATRTPDDAALDAFVVAAKAATYVGEGEPAPPTRPGSHDLRHTRGPFAYHDSYFGGSDFLGEEVVHHDGRPVWVMHYHGYLLDPGRIDAAAAGRVIKAALAALYARGRFLGGWTHRVDDLTYVDENEGDVARFHGVEHIRDDAGRRLYELRYHGGRVRD